MRIATILLAGLVLSGTGCSAIIHGRKAESKAPKDTTEVRAQLGEPVASGNVEGVRYEQFESRKKYLDSGYTGEYYLIPLVATGGLIELFLTPRELYLQSKRLAFGQHILVCYDERGCVLDFEVNRTGWKPLLPRQHLIEYLRSHPTTEAEANDRTVRITSRSESKESPASRRPGSSPPSSSRPR